MKHSSLLGVVLCGGESRRMGTDKGLKPLHNKVWAQVVADKFIPFQIPVVVSVNSGQQAAYSEYFNPEQLVVDSLNIGGPLNGLLSVHKQYPQHDLLLLACDMIDMDTPTITDLISAYQQQPEADYFIYTNEKGFDETFCAIYTTRALQHALKKTTDGLLIELSLWHLFTKENTYRLQKKANLPFNNYNTT